MGNRRTPRAVVAFATLRLRGPAKAIELGDTLLERGDVEGAQLAYQRAIDSGDVHGAPAGAWSMGVLLRDAGDMAGARTSFRRAIDSGHPTWSPRAAIDLAGALEADGDLAGARGLYEFAVASGDPSRSTGADLWARRAAVKLEILLTGLGDPDAAAAVHRGATGGDVERLAAFALDRAHELQQRGNRAGAAESLREAIELDDPRHSPRAAFMLSMLTDPP